MNKENSVAKQLEVKSNVLSQEAVHQKDIRKKNSKQEQLDAKKGIIKGMTDGDLSLIPEAMIE